MYYDNGSGGELIGEGTGTSNQEIIFDNVATGNGELFYSETTPLPSVDVYGTDCDDSDPSINPEIDGDCDGTLTADDCDDNDSSSTTLANDADCDGTLTADDCDDNDFALYNYR